MARTYTSTLSVELLDRLTGPGKRVAAMMHRLGAAVGDVTNPRTRLDAAMARNEAAIARARGGLVDAAAGAWALAGAFRGTVGASMALEDKMADISKVSGMNAAELKKFEGSLRNLARSEIPMAVEELAELAAAASQSGIANADLEAFTKQVAKSAVAWEVSGQYAGESLAKIKTALGMTIPETQRYADAINYLSDSGASNAPDLIEFARRVAADGKVAGFTNEQVLALGASMVGMGAEADVAATSLRNAQKALTRGGSATARQAAAFEKLGLNASDVAKQMPTDAMGTFLDVLSRINDLDQHERIATMSDLFGDEARALMPLLGQLDEVRKSTSALADETNYLGSVQKEFAERSKTGRYALQKFHSQIRDIAISIGQSLLPAMKRILETISPLMLQFADWAQQNPKVLAGVMSVVGGLVALRVAVASLRFAGLVGKGGALSGISMAMTAIGATGGRLLGAARGAIALQVALGAMDGRSLSALGRLTVGLKAMLMAIPGMGVLAGAIRAVGAAVLANPIGAAIAGIAAGAYLIYRNWEGVAAWFGQMWANVRSYFTGFNDFLIGTFTGDLTRSWDGVKQMWSASIATITGVFRAFGGTIQAVWTDMILPVLDKLAEVTGLTSAWESFKGAITAILDGIGSAFSGLMQRLSPVIDALKWVYDKGAAIVDTVGKAASAAASVGTGWVGSDRGTPIMMGPIPGRAKGGRISRGDTYQVGEDGPEIITARRSGYVRSNDKLGGGGAGSISINAPITITGVPGENAEALARRVIDLLDREVRGRMRAALFDTE